MFDTLSDRLNKALDGVRGSGNLTEDQVKKVTREIRLALLEADVNYGVVKEFVSNVRERAPGAGGSQAPSPGPPRARPQLRRRKGVRLHPARGGDRGGGLQGPEPGPADRQDRQRGAG